MDKLQQLRERLIPGAAVPLGRNVYVCPALSIKLLRDFKEELKLIQGGMQASTKATDEEKQEEFFGALCTVLTAALLRNYPEITLQEVEEGLDLSNVKNVTLTLMGASGFRIATQEEADKAVYGDAGESTGTA